MSTKTKPASKLDSRHFAIELHQAGKVEEALHLYKKLISEKPKDDLVLNLIGLCYDQKGDYAEAVKYYWKAIELNKKEFIYYINLGESYRKSQFYTRAIDAYIEGLTLNPDFQEGYHNCGNLLRELEMYEKADECYRRAIKLKSDDGLVRISFGVSLEKQGKLDEALIQYKTALDLRPDDLNAKTNLGAVFYELGHLDQAINYYDQVIAVDSNHAYARWNRAFAKLTLGDWNEGLIEYEWRFLAEKALHRQLDKPRWQGQDLNNKKILIWSEQGFGDALQFVRYVSAVKEKYPQSFVIVECRPEMERLFRFCRDIDRVVVGAIEKRVDFDFHSPMLSVPQFFTRNTEEVPQNVPYFILPPLPSDSRKYERLHIGFVWSGNKEAGATPKKNTSLRYFEPLIKLHGTHWVSLQKGPLDPLTLPEGLLFEDGLRDSKDFYDTALAIQPLDLIITTDTAIAHLAGAMGKEVWLLLCYVPDWRWLMDRKDSPWYPTMRIIRQKTLGDWDSVFEQLTHMLHERCKITGIGQK